MRSVEYIVAEIGGTYQNHNKLTDLYLANDLISLVSLVSQCCFSLSLSLFLLFYANLTLSYHITKQHLCMRAPLLWLRQYILLLLLLFCLSIGAVLAA